MSVLAPRVALQHRNTLGFTAEAEWYAAPRSVAECRAVLAEATKRKLPVTILGGGSNVVLGPWIPGLVLVPSMRAVRYTVLEDDNVQVDAEAGVVWSELVIATARRGLWGIENLALIPGHCGAAPVQNIGAYGVELADVVTSIRIMYLDGREADISAATAAFGYRDSLFKHALAGHCLITAISLKLSTRPALKLAYGDLASRVSLPCTPLDVVEAVSAVRREKLPDPADLGNAGSFFKNPVIDASHAQRLQQHYPAMPQFAQPTGQIKVPAAWLIDQCGFKGITRGRVGVHDRQPLVLVNRGGGDAKALLALADDIMATVAARFAIQLEPEPRQIGI